MEPFWDLKSGSTANTLQATCYRSEVWKLYCVVKVIETCYYYGQESILDSISLHLRHQYRLCTHYIIILTIFIHHYNHTVTYGGEAKIAKIFVFYYVNNLIIKYICYWYSYIEL